MTPTARDLEFAYRSWLSAFSSTQVDEAVKPFLEISPVSTSWLRLARTALMLSMDELGKRLGVNRSVYAHMEKSELTRTISLAQLERAAAAMDCELVYAIRPKSRRKFSEIVWERVLEEVLPRLARRIHLPHMRGHALAALAIEAMRSPKTRKKLGLARRRSRLRVSRS